MILESRYSRYLRQEYHKFRDDVLYFCNLLGFRPTDQQKTILKMVQHRAGQRGFITVKSGQGSGKTTVTAAIALWRAMRYFGGLTVVTAPTMRQCRNVFLMEVKQHIQKAPAWLRALCDISKMRVDIAGQDTWGIQAVTATKAENAQGIHRERGLTIIYDEASGISREIFEQFLGTMTGQDVLHLLIGNPTLRDCYFFDTHNSLRSKWEPYTINCEESPLVSEEHIRDLREEFGADSDLYRVRVLGEFPLGDPNCVFTADAVRACMSRDEGVINRFRRQSKVRQYGLDFARFGGDENVSYAREGDAIIGQTIRSHIEPKRLVESAFADQRARGWSDRDVLFVADAGGLGQGVMVEFHDTQKTVHEFHTQSPAVKSEMYGNKMTEAWFTLAKRMRVREVCIPVDETLVYQLTSRQYHIDSKARPILETKEQYTKRTKQSSPDRADALVMSFYDQAYVPVSIL